LTSRLWPISWPVELPDLKSRLKAATVVEIGEPDEDLLAQVIIKLFADRQLNIDDKLVGYIVARMERSLEAAQRIVDQLDRLALARGARITRSLAAEVLESFSRSDEGGSSVFDAADPKGSGRSDDGSGDSGD
jgi:chromosomal replication initiation ATPase DnaA